ncbi:MAG: undecaprenyl-diphosphate phosphatase [Xanthomonadales bacterium]|nr:undecaprenyl-diphosphate phosphatase [Gammaproteobacteria bacterium]MBT8052881.1 undecaprenyl-diphosphate phosphatase [Gammaproteobacteria bacterium]NND55658.1 undecaprenyl-diphosphate phosphatase [Xanthomonadales bacterium]NNK49969.1 undecaprenyl-diphosphate phosphatase [Xanthomonadales bacterium]
MSLIQIIVLALIQGLTEFLPVSSSAHLILGGVAFGWPDQGLVFDVATHLGTLAAVLFYFRRDLIEMIRALLGPARDNSDPVHRNMALYLAVSSIPALVIGFLAHDLIEFYLRDVRIIAATTIGFGLLLWLADALGARRRELENITLRSAVLIGLAQALALVPGVSRSGVTITAGRFLGFSPDAAARFSFLLSIPIIAAAGGYGMLKVATGDAPIDWAEFGLAMLFAAMAGWLCIAAFLALLKRVGLLPFVIYRLLLGAVLLWILF